MTLPFSRLVRCLTFALLSWILLGCRALEPQSTAPNRRSSISISEDGKSFVADGKRFVPWGFNYDHDRGKRLIEDYWEAEWPTIIEDFREMKALGANVVRIHLQFGRFMSAPDRPNEAALKQLKRLVQLAEESGLHLDLTGLACYRKTETPRWYDDLSEPARWQAQANFWGAVADACKNSHAIFCYDLMNEPFVGAKRKPGEWLAGEFGGFTFVQAITLDFTGRRPHEVAGQWAALLSAAIRKYDKKHMITVGMLPISGRDFVKTVGAHLDFLSVHEYPKSKKIADSVALLQTFNVGKPLVIEELFPLSCSAEELGEFIKKSSPPAGGWIGFYWGQTPEELKKAHGIAESMTLSWLDLFQEANPNNVK